MVNDDRGQLILVGAIAIALILLGLVLIVNTALFTQVVGSEGTVDSAKQGGVTAQEVGDSIAAVAGDANRQKTGFTAVNGTINDTVTDSLEPAFANRTAETSGSFVSMRYLGVEEDGRVIQQNSDAALGDGPLVDDGDVGQFLLTIDTAASQNEEVEIDVVSATGPPRTLTVEVNNAGNGVNLTGAGAGSDCSGISESGGEVHIDLRHGSVYEDGRCQFELFTNGTEEYDVGFDGGDDVTGQYVLATDDTSATPTGSGTDSYAAWRISYRFTYDSKSATVTSDYHEVDVYD